MTRSSRRHSNERLIDRIVNGDTQIVADDDPRDYEPEPPARWDEDRAIARMEDAYEREMDARWER